MANIIEYPQNPSIGDETTIGGTRKRWDGEKWINASFGNHENRIEANTVTLSAILQAEGYSGDFGLFARGFTYTGVGDLGVDTNNKFWKYTGTSFPHEVPRGTDPSTSSDYAPVIFSTSVEVDASNVVIDSNNNKLDGYIADTNLTLSSLLKAQGLSGKYGFFSKGLTIDNANDVGITSTGEIWQYVGTSPIPYTVAAGTVPSAPDYEQVSFNSASNVSNSKGGSVQDYINENLTPFETVAAMRAYDYSSIDSGSRIEWQGYYSQSDGGSNWGVLKKGDSTVLTDDGGSVFIIVDDAVNGIWIEANIKGQSVNVRKFGAKGDGINDDTISINNSHSVANNLNITIIKYPQPTPSYKTTSTITAFAGQHIKGDGKGRSQVNSVDCTAFTIDNSLDFTVSGMLIVSASKFTSTPNNWVGINFTQSGSGRNQRVTIKDTVIDGYEICIKAHTMWDSTIVNCRLNRCGSGIRAEGQSINNRVIGCTMNGGAVSDNYAAIRIGDGVTACEGWIIKSNVIDNFGVAIHGVNCSYNTVTGNILDHNYTKGIIIQGGANGASRDWVVAYNYIAAQGAVTAGVEIVDSFVNPRRRGHLIQGNVILRYEDSTLQYGIHINSPEDVRSIYDSNRIYASVNAIRVRNVGGRITLSNNVAASGNIVIDGTERNVVYINNQGDFASSKVTILQPHGDGVIAWGSSLPTSGAWDKGDLVYNLNPAVGQPLLWVCSVAGTPGTWGSVLIS